MALTRLIVDCSTGEQIEERLTPDEEKALLAEWDRAIPYVDPPDRLTVLEELLVEKGHLTRDEIDQKLERVDVAEPVKGTRR